MDRETKAIQSANVFSLLCCVILTLVTTLMSGSNVLPHIRSFVCIISMTVYAVGFSINILIKRASIFMSMYITMCLIYAGFLASYSVGSSMIFAVTAMFASGVAYFNKERIVNIIHAGITSLVLVVFAIPFQGNTVIGRFILQFKQFGVVEVVATIIGIIVMDAFFVLLNTGRLRQAEILAEQERSTDELMRIIETKAEEARKATKTKSDFLASMSHEIRTPINSVLGMNEMILRETQEQDIRRYAEDIQHAGNMLLSLINNILDFSKIESGKMEILPVKYDLSALINDTRIFVANRAKQKGLAFKVNAAKDLPRTLYGDEIRIKQIIMNILTNAVKYTEKGSILFSVDFDKADERSIFLKISISDTGRGMKKEDLEKLFAPFERIEELRNRHIEGTGLGMSIVQQLLAMMGSRLTVKSSYGEGSTFSFFVRQEVIDWTEIGDLSSSSTIKGKGKQSATEQFTAPDAKILVVDDIKMNLNVIVGLLKRTKIRVDTALSGEEAIRKMHEVEYDIIFIDHMMPEMDGIETLQRIKKDYSILGGDKPTVALTANAISGAREFYLQNGFVGYLSKPVDSKLLEKTIMELLPKELIATGLKDTEEEY
jgi:signal transduction histidine kinase/CheY-like chemotaxis protein